MATNHGGADVVISSNQEMYGEHINIGRFIVDSDVTLTVTKYDGDENSGKGKLIIRCKEAIISGTINADGKGYGGGGGGAGASGMKSWNSCNCQCHDDCSGGTCPGSCSTSDYQDRGGGIGHGDAGGQNGTTVKVFYRDHCHCFNPCGGDGGKGGGDYGGAGGIAAYGDDTNGNGGGTYPAVAPIAGGYRGSATNGDTSTNDEVYMGSGGGGGWGGHSQNTGSNSGDDAADGSGGGGAANPGGGMIRIYAEAYLEVNGNIYARGKGESTGNGTYGAGGSGGTPGNGGNGGNAYDSGTSAAGGSNHGSCAYYGYSGCAGEGGAGGGVLLYCNGLYGIKATGSIDNRGYRNADGQTTNNGGTLKILGLSNKIDATGTFNVGRNYQKDIMNAILIG